SGPVFVAQEEAGRLAMLANSGEAVVDAQMLASQMTIDANARLAAQSVQVEPTTKHASRERVGRALSARASLRALGSGQGAFPAIQRAKMRLGNKK
ncbi:MAG: hypothetical protein AAB914_03915, partial [Patescibacteria group bacterium]